MDYKINYAQAPAESVTITLRPSQIRYIINSLMKTEMTNEDLIEDWMQENYASTLTKLMEIKKEAGL